MRVHKIARKCKRVHDGAQDGTTFTCRAGGRIGLVGLPNSPRGLPAYSHGGAMLNGVVKGELRTGSDGNVRTCLRWEQEILIHYP